MYIWSQLIINEWENIYPSNSNYMTVLKEFKLNKNFISFISNIYI